MKWFDKKVTRHVRDLYTRNHKSLLNENKVYLNTWRNTS